MGGIRISAKHGVNPAIPVCFFCGKDKNEIVLPGRIGGHQDLEAPKHAVWNKEPCDECKGWMAQGVILISVRDGESGDNPYRTGRWVVVTDEALKRVIKPGPLLENALKNRMAFMPDEAWERSGLQGKGGDV